MVSGLVGGIVYLLAGVTKPSAAEAAEASDLSSGVASMSEPSAGGS
jgi:hypothetical protein